MNEEELIERIKELKNLLSSEVSEHTHLRRIAEDKVLKAYHTGHLEARRVIIDRILDITSKHYQDMLAEAMKEKEAGNDETKANNVLKH
ncbi:hypothetical protein DRN97_07130 [Methanosarcinales archaeon]|nr:MAG: hypothetical protein DRN97_07130 [Methanosarcinales archaeon]